MKPVVLVSCRVDHVADRNEWRDAVDQRLTKFLWEAGFSSINVPNFPDAVHDVYKTAQPVGLILSGGNDIGERPERDETERHLVQIFKQNQKPILGICRGMQFLISEAGGQLEKVSGHAGTRHPILSSSNQTIRDVNSYHNLAPLKLPPSWENLAHTEDGCIEWMMAPEHVQGIMWHPERESTFHPADLKIFREHFAI